MVAVKAQNKHLRSSSKSGLVLAEVGFTRTVGAPKTLFLFSLFIRKYNFFSDVGLTASVLTVMPKHGLGDFLQIACEILMGGIILLLVRCGKSRNGPSHHGFSVSTQEKSQGWGFVLPGGR